MGELDVDQPPVLSERQHPAEAAGELLAAGEVGAVGDPVFDPLLLGAGDHPAGDDRRQDQHRGRDGERPQAARAELAGRRRPARGVAAQRSTSSDPEQQHREAEVGRDQVLVRLFSTVSPPSTACASTSIAGGDRAAAQEGPARGQLARLPYAEQDQHRRRSRPEARWENSITAFSSISGSARPPHSGQPSSPLPAGPQPSPESVIRTTPPTTISTKVATMRDREEEAKPAKLAAARLDASTWAQAIGCATRRPLALAAPRWRGDRVADVTQRLVAAHVGKRRRSCGAGRREREPFQRGAAPGIVPGADAGAEAADRVDQRQHDSRARARRRRSSRPGCSRSPRCPSSTCRRPPPGPAARPGTAGRRRC